ncbi:uncharacterized protein LOC143361270 isoform X2 [Halictus rubicundus]|uniref:uncharacterized protein LOC143361270 isoform X2 n=1 Tax=Halictus rubicundus TaxID=77578 RepID=UPI004037243C
MELLEEYQELVERDAADISWLWKLSSAFFYMTSAVTGYICSILFYVIWNHAFDDNCPLWAKSVLMVPVESEGDDIADEVSVNLIDENWWDYIITDYDYKYRCKIYFTTCFLSCVFGTIWFAMFLICGKGGHDIAIFQAPWRIVFPATIFNVIFVIITTYIVTNLEKGYLVFSQNLKSIYINMNTSRETPKLIRVFHT